MEKNTAISNSVVIILIVLANTTISSSSRQALGRKQREKITVVNDLGENLNLMVHCFSYSQKYDEGTKFIPYGGRYQWFAQEDLYICELDWAKRGQAFLLYDSNRDDERCNPGWCFWRVNQDGLYLSLKNPDRFELQFIWEKIL